ncbi:probable glutamate receptor [Gigantopelta aegis]|uniref:probable glutamate receptor n=1 Tax=Gigantopelta aegis TaxID=1735272 RepID=UPI001B88914D|nr:probable glutamate receptor [Gigantopelta aegis]
MAEQKICHALTEQSDVLIAVTGCSKLRVLEQESTELAMLLIAIHVDPCHDKVVQVLPVSTLRIQPRIRDAVDVIVSIIDYFDYSKVAVIFDASVFAGINEIRHELSARLIETSFTQLANKEQRDVLLWLQKLKKLGNRTVCALVLLDNVMTVDLLKTWSSMKPTSNTISWLSVLDLVNPDMFNTVVEADYVHRLILATSLTVSDIPTKLGMFSANTTWLDNFTISDTYLFDSIVYIAELFNDVMNRNASIGTRRSSCYGKQLNTSTLSQDMISAIDKVSTNKTLASPVSFGGRGYNSDVTYHIINAIRNNGTQSLEPVGSWTTSGGLVMMKHVFSDREQGLENMKFRIGTNEAPPFTVFRGGRWEGICIDILNELAARLHFQYELVRPADRLWGSSTKDGSWNGIVGMTTRGECDFGVGPFSLSAERESVIDFTKPFMEDGSGLIMKRFEDKNSKMFRTFKPFSRDVWILIAGSIIVVGLILCAVNNVSPTSGSDEDEKTPRGRARTPRGLADNLWIVYGSYMEQGAEKTPANISGRFILGFWWVFTILMVASYTANLAAFLTVSFSDEPISSLEDLAKQSEIRPLVKSGSNLETLFKKSETETHQRIWEMLQTSPRVTNNSAALQLVLSGRYAFMSDSMQLKLMKTEDCDNLMIAESTFNVVGLAFIVSESSPLLEILSVNIIKLLESGLIEKWKQKWFSSTNKICTDVIATSSVKSLELESTVGPFLVFSVSTTLALICLAVEHVIYHVTKWRCGKKSDAAITLCPE